MRPETVNERSPFSRCLLKGIPLPKLLLSVLLIVVSFGAMAKHSPHFGPTNKEYHHWANGGSVKTTTQWQNGALQQTNSHYAEGDVVPHVYTPDTKDWVQGSDHSIIIEYDYLRTQGGGNTGGFNAFVDNFAPFTGGYLGLNGYSGYFGETPVQIGSFYSTNIRVTGFTRLTSEVAPSIDPIQRVKLDFIFTGSKGGNAAIYFGLRLAKADEVDPPSQGASQWPGASLHTSLDGDGSRTLSINLDPAFTCNLTSPSISVDNNDVCKDGTQPVITFSASGGTLPYTFFYTDPNGDPQTISTNGNNSSVTLQVPTTTPGTFTYALTKVENQTCEIDATEAVTVVVGEPATANASGDQTICSDGTVTLNGSINGVASSATWGSAGDGSFDDPNKLDAVYTPGANDIASGSVILTLTTDDPAGACDAGKSSITITINPVPTIDAVTDRVHCNKDAGSAIVFSGTATAFNWTSTTDVGFGTNGNGVSKIDTYQASNSGTFPITATVTVTPLYTANGVTCSGTSINFSVTVNPTPVANALTDRTHCHGESGSAISFGGTATSFNWTSSENVGFGTGANGVQGISSYTASNTGNAPKVATVTVTPVYENAGVTCTGDAISFTVTVNPLPPCTITKNSPSGNPQVGQTASYSGPSGSYSYAWSLTNNTANASFASGVNTGQNVSVVTTTTGSYTITLVVTNTATLCVSSPSCSQSTTVSPSALYTTYTKGFWGTAGGAFCGGSGSDKLAVLNFMYSAFGGATSKTFGTGAYQFTLMRNTCENTGTATKPAARIWKLLPGGSTPSVLTCNGATSDRHIMWNCVPIDAVSSSSTYESIRNNLLAQGIAMFFNMAKDVNLKSADAILYGNKLTFTGSGSCTSGSTVQTIPLCVYNAAKTANGGVVTVQSIYNIAMRVLGADPSLTGISAANANAALDALNVGFDKGKQITGVQMDNTPCAAARMMPDVVSAARVAPSLAVSAYPNPYSESIRFTIANPKEGRGSLEVFNMLGQKVKVVYSGFITAGTHTYEFNVPTAQRATLLYRFTINDKTVTGKVLQAKE